MIKVKVLDWPGCCRVAAIALVLVFVSILFLNPSQTQAKLSGESYTIERYYAEYETPYQETQSETAVQALAITFTPRATKYYLVLASACTNNSVNGEYTQTELVIDGTTHSLAQYAPVDTNNNWRSHAAHEIIQLDATPHTIEWQYFRQTGGTGWARVKGLRIAVIEISNYYYGEAEAWSKTTSTSYTEKTTTGSFTPSATADYLALVALNQRNKASSGASGTQFTIDEVPEDEPIHTGSNYSSYSGFAKENLDNTSHNLDIDYRRVGTQQAEAQYAHVAAVLLSDLGTENVYSESLTESGNTTTTYSTKTTLNITPTERGDYLIIGMTLGNLTDTADVFEADLDLDSGTNLATYLFKTGDATAYNSFFVVKKVNLTAALHPIIMQWRRGVNSTGNGTANIKSTKIIAIRLNTTESYTDSNYTIVDDDYSTGETTAYIWAHGLDTSTNYDVAYYDAGINGGEVQGGDNNIAPTAYGNLSSTWDLSGNSGATVGLWHAVVFRTGSTPPTYYNDAAGTAGYIAADEFDVQAGAIPEFPTVIAGIVVAVTSFGIFYWMRKRRLAYVKV